jgi:hypothetical protein
MIGGERGELPVTDTAVLFGLNCGRFIGCSLDAPLDSVRVIITEILITDYGIAGQSVKQKRAAALAIE